MTSERNAPSPDNHPNTDLNDIMTTSVTEIYSETTFFREKTEIYAETTFYSQNFDKKSEKSEKKGKKHFLTTQPLKYGQIEPTEIMNGQIDSISDVNESSDEKTTSTWMSLTDDGYEKSPRSLTTDRPVKLYISGNMTNTGKPFWRDKPQLLNNTNNTGISPNDAFKSGFNLPTYIVFIICGACIILGIALPVLSILFCKKKCKQNKKKIYKGNVRPEMISLDDLWAKTFEESAF
jgi:hypothetical protein